MRRATKSILSGSGSPWPNDCRIFVTLSRCEPYMNALRMLDPEAYPTPDMLPLDPELAQQLLSSIA